MSETLAAFVAVMAGCASEPASVDAGPIALFDAPFVCPAWCNTLMQSGCLPDEKCVKLSDPLDESCLPFRCVPDGDVPNGEACTVGPAGPSSYDDCQRGNVCSDGVCKQICTSWPDSCEPGYSCFAYPELFSPNADAGLCEAHCDVIEQDCDQNPDHADGTGCYVVLTTGATACRPARAETEDGTPGVQGERCTYLNTCAVGYGCTQLDDPVNPTGNVCAFFCDADAAGGPTCADGPGASLTCVAINGGFYGDATNVDPQIGMCVDCAVWTDVPGCL